MGRTMFPMTDPPQANDPAMPGPAALPITAAPSVAVRVVAFVSILAAGTAGGFIGWSISDLQCAPNAACSTATAVSGLVGALIGSIGVAIVVVLAMRAMTEWHTIQARNPEGLPSQKRTPDGGRRPNVRVR